MNINDQQAGTSSSTLPKFADFNIIRSIGRGTFGKVCIVELKRNGKKQFYAMKYVNKRRCLAKNSMHNVLLEIEMMDLLCHPMLVNLWYAFQDYEDMFMVFDLLLGGDLRYHLNQEGRFAEDRVKLYAAEMALALDYLRRQKIVHRDVKPDNILLDDSGHCKLADFNVATMLDHDCLATSITGTRPYMAPEIYATAIHRRAGYCYAVDWYSLGVCVYEMLRGRRPFDFGLNMGTETEDYTNAYHMLMNSKYTVPGDWSTELLALVTSLLKIDSEKRIQTLPELRSLDYMSRVNFTDVLRRKTVPTFVPSKNSLNCDPTYELEEQLIEERPIHKKKKRLEKDYFNRLDEETRRELQLMEQQFRNVNRENELSNEESRLTSLEYEHELIEEEKPAPVTQPDVNDNQSKVSASSAKVYLIGNLTGTPQGNKGKKFGFRDMLKKRHDKKKSTC